MKIKCVSTRHDEETDITELDFEMKNIISTHTESIEHDDGSISEWITIWYSVDEQLT